MALRTRRVATPCGEFGWNPIGDADPTLVADLAHYPRCGAGRAWSASGNYETVMSPQRIYLVHTVEGAIDFFVDGQHTTVGPGELILLDGEVSAHAKATSPTARFLWFFEPTFLQHTPSRLVLNEPIGARSPSMSALLSMTNSVLNAPKAPSSRNALAHLGSAVEHLVVAALDETGAAQTELDAIHRDRLYSAAQAVIESRFRDPGFNAAALAKALSVSSRSVYAAFSSFGTTPRREIERRRFAEVDRLADRMLPHTERVERAGFSSVRQYNRAAARRHAPPEVARRAGTT